MLHFNNVMIDLCMRHMESMIRLCAFSQPIDKEIKEGNEVGIRSNQIKLASYLWRSSLASYLERIWTNIK